MQINKLFPLVAFLVGLVTPVTQAVPLAGRGLSKRAVPRLGGVNLAGCEFGTDTNGGSGTTYCPSADQIGHFVSKGANLIRLPVNWQALVGNNQASTSLATGLFTQFDNLVKASLSAGAYVMIDLHNYARWNGGIVGQGGPTDANFAAVWTLLATKYKDQPKVIFGLMNEPHDVPDNTKWAASVQAAVNAIRAAGAKSQIIALPGNFWAHADDWLNGNNNPLLNVKDPATGDKSLLVLDVHKYLDGNGSGTSRDCVTDGTDTWAQLGSFLSKNGYKALISEIGGGNTQSCITNLGKSLNYLASHPDQYMGFAVWSAGSFDTNYELSITPSNGQDNDLFVKAIQPYLPGAGSPAPAPISSAAPIKVSSSAAPVVTSSAKPVVTSSAKPVVTSSAAPKPSTSAIPPKPSTSSAAVSKPVTSSAAPKPSSVAPAPSSAAPKPSSSIVPVPVPSSSAAPKPSSVVTSAAPAPTGGNLQTYVGTVGPSAPPAVTKGANGQYTSNGRTFNFLVDALNASCYAQMDKCQNAANQGGNKGTLTVGACNGQQVQECLKVASGTQTLGWA